MARCLIVVLFVLACLGSSVSALSSGEELALIQLRNVFPLLLAVNPMDQYVCTATDDFDYGGSWTKEISKVCTEGDGWDIHGIRCFEGHIAEIRFTFDATFGPGTQPDADSSAMLFAAVLALPSLKHVTVNWLENDYFPLAAFQAANLTHVQLSVLYSMSSKPSFAAMEYLEEVVLNYAQPFTDFYNSASTLRHLLLDGVIWTFSGLSDLHKLEYLHIVATNTEITEFSLNVQIPQSLLSFSTNGWSSQTLSIGNDSSHLHTLFITSSLPLNQIAYLPPSLKSFSIKFSTSINSWPDWSSGYGLEEFSMETTGTSIIPAGLEFCSSLRKLNLFSIDPTILDTLVNINMDSIALEYLRIEATGLWPSPGSLPDAFTFLCSLSPSLQSLILKNTKFEQLPPCMTQFVNLKEFNMLESIPSNVTYTLMGVSSSLRILRVHPHHLGIKEDDDSGWTTMAMQFPNLKILEVAASSGADSAFPGQALMNLHLLEELILSYLLMPGSIPTHFLESLQNLKILKLNVNSLSGSIPSSGWGQLQEVDLSANEFSVWHDLDPLGAQKLRDLKISSSPLVSIPGDASFLNMPQLRYLEAKSISSQQPIPAFWNNGMHKLSELELYDSSFQGLMPDMNSPYLRVLDLSYNALCGPLPEVNGPMGLLSLLLPGNHFSGPIPDSWGSHLFVRFQLALGGNDIGGEMPFPFLHPNTASWITVITLNSNYFTGPLPNMSSYVTLNTFAIEGSDSTWDFCSQNPDFPTSLIPNKCSVTQHASMCSCKAWYASACLGVLAFCDSEVPTPEEPTSEAPIAPPIARSPIYPPNRTCTTNPSGPSYSPPEAGGNPPIPSIIQCLSSPPSLQFHCINGQWVSDADITIPTLVLSPNSGNIFVNGSVSSETLVFEGLGSSLTVEGCIYLSGGITIELDDATETKGPIILLEQKGGSNCTSSLQDLNIAIKEPKSCKKTKFQKDSTLSNNNRLAVLFEIDSSSCNTKWIILGSVLGAVVIIITIGTIIAYKLSPSFRKAISPFSGRSKSAV